jgi:hypothetical protein
MHAAAGPPVRLSRQSATQSLEDTRIIVKDRPDVTTTEPFGLIITSRDTQGDERETEQPRVPSPAHARTSESSSHPYVLRWVVPSKHHRDPLLWVQVLQLARCDGRELLLLLCRAMCVGITVEPVLSTEAASAIGLEGLCGLAACDAHIAVRLSRAQHAHARTAAQSSPHHRTQSYDACRRPHREPLLCSTTTHHGDRAIPERAKEKKKKKNAAGRNKANGNYLVPLHLVVLTSGTSC